MNSIVDLLKSHRSIRRFKNQPIDVSVLTELIQAGQSASTSSYIQATTVIRIADKSVRQKFVELTGNQKYVATAPEFLIFCADFNRNYQCTKRVMDNSEQSSLDFGWTELFISATVDVALFAQNVVIAAESQGLGCCYIGGVRNDLDQVTELLELPKRVYPVFGLCVGVPDQDPAPKPRLPVDVVLHQDKYRHSDDDQALIDRYDAHVGQYYNQRTKGRLKQTWTEQIAKQMESETRSYIKNYLVKQGFIDK